MLEVIRNRINFKKVVKGQLSNLIDKNIFKRTRPITNCIIESKIRRIKFHQSALVIHSVKFKMNIISNGYSNFLIAYFLKNCTCQLYFVKTPF